MSHQELELATVERAAAMLNVNRCWIDHLVRQGLLTMHRVGDLWAVNLAELRERSELETVDIP